MAKKFALLAGLILSGLLGLGAAEWVASFTTSDLPLDPDARIWTKAKPFRIELTPQQITFPFGGGSVRSVEVRALLNSKVIGFHLQWSDATRDVRRDLNSFRDAAALMFPLNLEQPPSPFMGHEKGRVLIWMWKADWQEQMGGKEVFARAYADFYNPEDPILFRLLGNRPLFHPAVEELIAEGFGTLTRKKVQAVIGRGTYSRGGWKVVFIRKLGASDPGNISFSPGMDLPVNVAIWNGSEGDVGARKSVSLVWNILSLQKPK